MSAMSGPGRNTAGRSAHNADEFDQCGTLARTIPGVMKDVYLHGDTTPFRPPSQGAALAQVRVVAPADADEDVASEPKTRCPCHPLAVSVGDPEMLC
jgi:hypothetical protein